MPFPQTSHPIFQKTRSVRLPGLKLQHQVEQRFIVPRRFCDFLYVAFISVIPIPSMYGIFTYIWLMFMVNVGKYNIHGWYGICVMHRNRDVKKCHL